MLDMSADAYRRLETPSFWQRHQPAIQQIAAYGSVGLIAAIVLGSLSVHPF